MRRQLLRYLLAAMLALTVSGPLAWHAHPAQAASTPPQTYFGQDDQRNYSDLRYAGYRSALVAISLLAPGAGPFIGPIPNSSFFGGNLSHWLGGSGTPEFFDANNSISRELRQDPGVLEYFASGRTAGNAKWRQAMETFVAGQAAAFPCPGAGTIQVTAPITYEAARDGIGLAFGKINGVYGVGKPYKAASDVTFTITLNSDGSMSYTGSGHVTLDKNWGWVYPDHDDYSKWPSKDINFGAWYVEYYGGARTFHLTMDLGQFDWTGYIPPPPGKPCQANGGSPLEFAPVQLTPGATTSLAQAISPNGTYIDGTYGYGGSSWLVANRGLPQGLPIGVDRSSVNNAGTVVGSVGGRIATVSPNGGTQFLPTVADPNSPTGQFPDDANFGVFLDRNGDVAGTSHCPPTVSPCSSSQLRAFLYPAGIDGNTPARDLGTLGGGTSPASLGDAVGGTGSVVGTTTRDTGANQGTTVETVDFLAPGGASMTMIGPAPAPSGSVPNPVAINDNGLIVGNTFLTGGHNSDAFKSANGAGYVDLGGLGTIPNSQYCGTGKPGGGYKVSAANAVNNVGTIVGSSAVPGGPFYYSCGTDHATIWPAGSTSPIDLNSTIPAGSGWTLSEATGIDDTGDIIGNGTFLGSQQAFILVAPSNVVSGVVGASDQSPTSGLTVTATDANGATVGSATTDAQGGWTMSLRPGRYTVTVTGYPAGDVVKEGAETVVVGAEGAVANFDLLVPAPACDANANCDAGQIPEPLPDGSNAAPPAPAGSSDPAGGTSNDPYAVTTVANGNLTATGHGAGGITLAHYAQDPVKLPPPLANPAYFDLRAAGHLVGAQVHVCNLPAGTDSLEWFDGTGWNTAVRTVISAGCLDAEVTSTTSPSLYWLTGTPFAVGKFQKPAATGTPTPLPSPSAPTTTPPTAGGPAATPATSAAGATSPPTPSTGASLGGSTGMGLLVLLAGQALIFARLGMRRREATTPRAPPSRPLDQFPAGHAR
ncbi:MAG: carboxypeptidase regulatory-like domain-containing protein [Candidatus Dormibacteraeota bacterium]|uniref:Carboxypeptidase regulatory-like domain-containing protein n=1 Tax=Candidatus Amunia macphersoniae TaxID=3127014 RepID=A0A934KP97_9BACT|nr:carboxypeptidase regulatory-like domain-containing protein [Candidatus Dormibacteraeota bacterium]